MSSEAFLGGGWPLVVVVLSSAGAGDMVGANDSITETLQPLPFPSGGES